MKIVTALTAIALVTLLLVPVLVLLFDVLLTETPVYP